MVLSKWKIVSTSFFEQTNFEQLIMTQIHPPSPPLGVPPQQDVVQEKNENLIALLVIFPPAILVS